MNQSDKLKFSDILFLTSELYGRTISINLIQLYFDVLKKYPIETVNDSFERHLSDPEHGQFFPRPADIVRNIVGIERSANNRAIHAWLEIESTMRTVGAYGSFESKDKQAQIALQSFGSWSQFCSLSRDKLDFKRKEFIEIYLALEKKPISESDSLNLKSDQQNVFRINDDS